MHSRLNYGNGELVGPPAYLMNRQQSILNAAARLIYRLRTRDHTTYVLISVCTGCGFQNEFSTSWLFWRTEFYMATHHVTLVR